MIIPVKGSDRSDIPSILCLHGSHQDGEIFSQRCKQLVLKMKDRINFRFISADIEMELQDGEEVPMRTWWSEKGNPTEIQHAIDLVSSEWNSFPHYIGLIGFSQGASLCAYALKNRTRFPGLLFGIIAGGILDECMPGLSPCDDDPPTLCFAGLGDTLVPASETKKLSSTFKNSQYIEHSGGHSLPMGVTQIDTITNFINITICNQSLSEETIEEVETLRSVYEEVTFNELEKSIQFDHTIDVGRYTDHITRVKVFLTSLYPNVAPRIEFSEIKGPGGWLQKSVWRNELKTYCNDQCIDLLGSPMLYALKDMIVEMLSEISSRKEDTKEGDTSEEVQENGVLNETEEQRASNVLEATAIMQSIDILDSDWSDAWGKGGQWKYVIGLVGKPSAGKSTLFNAATGDATAARVAAHPFTTIEPNTGDAFACIPCPCQNESLRSHFNISTQCNSQHGHSASGDRFCPITIRDVAGLVPGAYQGRGKGNKFLDDLNDADVLVHVVDASGLTNSEGSQTEQSDEKAVLEEVRWVRREIHQWIYTNVSRKWDSLRRKPQRLPIMFTGYHATESMVALAAKKAGITQQELESLASWPALTLHKLVAAFIRVRFPIVIAMNKCDVGTAVVNSKFVRENLPANQCVIDLSANYETQLIQLRESGAIHYRVGGTPEGDVPENIIKFLNTHNNSTGVTEVISRAVSLRPTVRVFPVIDAATLNSYGEGTLRHCLQLTPGSTAADLFRVLSRNHFVEGDYIRASIVSEDYSECPIKKDVPLPQDAVVRIMTNRKSKWQADHKPAGGK
eukprot:TRINITY_DN18682_c0_g1_i2.p1 TRINITY_DN18682_c0_g1~~TRINITY_DN18682_c0_g1_i2.p1  ORF type:complete len:794 (+),score=148.22 TRINITY_DN18682_c0_g1_i2:73-2454(+)